MFRDWCMRERETETERERERERERKTLQTHIHVEKKHLHAPENVQPFLFLALSIQEFVDHSY